MLMRGRPVGGNIFGPSKFGKFFRDLIDSGFEPTPQVYEWNLCIQEDVTTTIRWVDLLAAFGCAITTP
jgi:hypothetical protein